MARTTRPKANPALAHVDDKTIECRGGMHDWPQLRIGKLPKGISAIPLKDGTYQLKITCRNCSRTRTRTTLPRGYYDASATYTYKGGPEDFESKPLSERAGLRKPDYTVELYRRNAENGTLEASSVGSPEAKAAEAAAAASGLGKALL